jgi:hypothetical protein
MIRGADLSHADICEISTELEGKPRPATPRPRSSPPARPIAAAVVRGPSTPVADCPVTSAGFGLAGTWVPNSAVAPVRPACGTCAALLHSLGRPGCSGRRNCTVNLDELRGDRPDLHREPQQAGGIPRNLQLDETHCMEAWSAGPVRRVGRTAGRGSAEPTQQSSA